MKRPKASGLTALVMKRIALLSVQLVVFPSISNINDQMTFWQKLYAIFLPCLTLAMVVTAHMMRQTRAAIINILSSPFIEMANLKGLRRLRDPR